MDESRRGARVATRFLVAVEGLDIAPVLRKGDISATGLYFEIDRDVGDVGTVVWLILTSLDGSRSVRVMAHVVRTVKLGAVAGRSVSGAAFEFMPESDEVAAQLRDFVRRVLTLRKHGDAPTVSPRLGARVGDASTEHDATVHSLSVRSLVLETSWAIHPGEHLRVDIVAPGMTRRLRLDGLAVRVAPKPGSPSRYDIEVAVQQEMKRPLRADSAMAIEAVDPRKAAEPPPPPPDSTPSPDDEVTRALDDLLAALILPPEDEAARRRRTHLSGELSRIRLPTLLSLFEMDRLTGQLTLVTGAGERRIYLLGGRVVDVEPVPAGKTRRDCLAELVAAEGGRFEFTVVPVDRVDHMHTSTTALLLDLAREADERSAPRQ
jgi:hypothetical protein